MNSYDDRQMLAALALLVAALFVSSGLPLPPQWRRRIRIGAIAVFAIAVIIALGKSIAWLTRD